MAQKEETESPLNSGTLNIRHMRLRLGWTRDRMARELNCSPQRVFSLEQKQSTPTDCERRCLERLQMTIGNVSQGHTRRVLADALLECQNNSQMSREELEEGVRKQFKVDIDL